MASTTQPGATARNNRKTAAIKSRNINPKLLHLIHHIEPGGVIHAFCGVTFPQTASTGKYADTVPCAACDAAKILLTIYP